METGDPDAQDDGFFFDDRPNSPRNGGGLLNTVAGTFFDGSDFDEFLNGRRGTDIPEFVITTSLKGSAGVGVGSFSLGGGVEVKIPVEFDFVDPNGDGKVRLSETNALVDDSSVFSILAAFDVLVNAQLLVTEVTLVDIRVFDFTLTNGSQLQPTLAANDNGVLRLNMGPRAADRLNFNTDDGAEQFLVEPGDDDGTVTVKAFGFSQEFTGVSSIFAEGGAFDDELIVHPQLTMPVEFAGGDGSDKMIAGAGIATFRGGVGEDIFVGGPAGDIVFGGDGADNLSGNGGDDFIDGESGGDLISGGRGVDTLYGGSEGDTILGGREGDIISGGDGVDEISGELGDDTIRGDLGDDRPTRWIRTRHDRRRRWIGSD